ncbi:hypothetical protein HMPREF0262_01492 [Clostridium sp. ATCC 29733]|nr:hypothetical protein HMPREF0262_01492 [Clostridium sp. ATCC 29733]
MERGHPPFWRRRALIEDRKLLLCAPPLPENTEYREGRSPSVKRRAPAARERAPQAQKRPPFICGHAADERGAPCAAATCPSGRGQACAPGFRRFRGPFESGPVSLYSSSNWPV